MNRGKSGWTDERIETLKKLWGDGLSASEIATALGGVGRMGVIGKVHRLSLAGRPRSGGLGGARMAKPRADKPKVVPALKPTARGTNSPFGNQTRKLQVRASAPIPKRSPIAEPPVPPTARMLPLLALTSRSMCRWPVGEATGRDQLFCGCTTKRPPYCDGHAAIAGAGYARRAA